MKSIRKTGNPKLLCSTIGIRIPFFMTGCVGKHAACFRLLQIACIISENSLCVCRYKLCMYATIAVIIRAYAHSIYVCVIRILNEEKDAPSKRVCASRTQADIIKKRLCLV